MKYKLEIEQIERTCLFKLSWGKGQQISAKIPYPVTLFQFYLDWRKAYLNFYKTSLRARVPKPKKLPGKIQLPQDWHRQLVQLEAKLLSEFHRWLRREELYEIRHTITTINYDNNNVAISIDLFLTCSGDLARLPWETWEIGAKLNSIVRSPINIRADTKSIKANLNRKPRILAILGDDTGLDLKSDRDTINALYPYHIWNERMIGDRLNWKSDRPLFLLLLRAYRLPQPQIIPFDRAYRGCKSWIDLLEPISTAELIPVLDDAAYHQKVAEIINLIDD